MDRAAVRALALELSDGGSPAGDGYPEKEMTADVLVRYYLEFEPRSLFIAEVDGRIGGYLAGCVDTRRYLQVFPRILRRCVLRAPLKAAWWKPSSIRFAWGALGSWRNGANYHEDFAREYPAHLHVNVSDRCRGLGLGRSLVERFCTYARDRGVRGIHLGCRADNPAGRAFFESVGFSLAERRHARLATGGVWTDGAIDVLVRRL